jgi:hypothetical protein
LLKKGVFRRTTNGKPSADGTFGDYVRTFNPPEEMLYSTKEGAGDFFLRAPDNPLLASSAAPRLRNFSVELDVFRQYEGWGALLIWMGSWGDRAGNAFFAQRHFIAKHDHFIKTGSGQA